MKKIKQSKIGAEINKEDVSSPKMKVLKARKTPPKILGTFSKSLLPLLLEFIKKEYKSGEIDIIEKIKKMHFQIKYFRLNDLL